MKTLDLNQHYHVPGTLAGLFTNGKFRYYLVLVPSVVTEEHLPERRAVFQRFADASPSEVQALPEKAQTAALQLMRQEYARVLGTAIRKSKTVGGPKGGLLPKLSFPNHTTRYEYQKLLKAAFENFQQCRKAVTYYDLEEAV